MKVCSTCKVQKEISEFYIHKGGSLGVGSKCKSCIKIATKVRNSDPSRKLKTLARSRDYHAKNRENILSKARAKYAKNAEACREQQQTKYAENIELSRERSRLKAKRRADTMLLNSSQEEKARKQKFKDQQLLSNEERLTQRKLYSQRYYELNKEKIRKQTFQRRETNRDKVNSAAAERRKLPSCNARNVSKLPPSDKALFIDGKVTVVCFKCGARTAPPSVQIYRRIQAYIGTVTGEAHIYCSDQCKDSCPVFNFKTNSTDPRSTTHVSTSTKIAARLCQTAHLKALQCDEVGHNYCERCGRSSLDSPLHLHLHHTLPVAHYGKEAINSAGHILLCAECHKALHLQC